MLLAWYFTNIFCGSTNIKILSANLVRRFGYFVNLCTPYHTYHTLPGNAPVWPCSLHPQLFWAGQRKIQLSSSASAPVSTNCTNPNTKENIQYKEESFIRTCCEHRGGGDELEGEQVHHEPWSSHWGEEEGEEGYGLRRVVGNVLSTGSFRMKAKSYELIKMARKLPVMRTFWY